MQLPDEIEDQIARTAQKLSTQRKIESGQSFRNGYVYGATLYASEMIGFAEWCTENYYKVEPANKWVKRLTNDAKPYSTLELLVYYFKEKQK